jgi:protein-tyrosine phosphatase
MPTATVPLLAGAPNFRDLGGYPTTDGRRIRRGILYRSEGLAELTDADLAIVETLGIRLICDLRSDNERQQIPTRWPTGSPASTLHMNISADLRTGYDAMAQVLVDNPSAQGATQAMLISYRQFPHAFASKLRLLFDSLLTGDGTPLVFHCAAGKDRTGFVAAMLLSALGVPRERILEDYLLTARYWQGPRSELALKRVLHVLFGDAPPTDILQPLIAVDERYLAASLEEIINHYESIDSYLELTAGVGARQREALRRRLLE